RLAHALRLGERQAAARQRRAGERPALHRLEAFGAEDTVRLEDIVDHRPAGATLLRMMSCCGVRMGSGATRCMMRRSAVRSLAPWATSTMRPLATGMPR